MRKYIIAAITVFAGLTPAFVNAATLDQVRLSFQHDPRTTMTSMWRTQENQAAPKVQYGASASYGSEVSGTSQPAVLDGYFYHTVELTGLTPNTLYHYHVSGEAGAWSGDNTFRTAPDGPADFSFTAFGDNGTSAEGGNAPLRINDLVTAQNAAFHLIAGDLTYADGDRCDGRPCPKERWELWFQEIERYTRTVPTMPAIGNHEIKSDVKFSSGETFYERSLALPRGSGTELYYSFDYGDVHFIALDSNQWQSLRRNGAQYNWLQADLAATTKRWKIVYFHHLAYTSGETHSDIEAIQQETSPLFDQYEVDLVINGHNHHYERTFPLRYNAPDNPTITSTDRASYTGADGVVYMITGGGGRGTYRFRTEQPAWSVVRCECHEIVRVDVDDAGVLTVRTIKIDGSIIDQFTISKTGAVAAPPPIVTAPSPQPTPAPAPSPPPPTPTTTPPPVLTPSPYPLKPIQGFNLAVWSRDALGSSDARQSMDDLQATGANYVAFAPFWYQDGRTSSALYRRSSKTATDESLRIAIRYAKSKGLQVALKPMVDARDNTWRGNFEPSDPNAWFQSYHEMMLTYARIAQDESIDYLIVGTEFTKLTKSQYTAKWRELITAVRQVYRGSLTYAANWGKTHEGEYYQVEFWDALDSIGIDAYFPVATDGNPTVASVESAWTSINSGGAQNWFADIRSLHERFGKPVIFTEMGYLSCDSAGMRPWEYPCGRAIDLQEQATLYEGTMKFWADKDWMQGFLWWRFDVDPDKGGLNNGDFLVQNKPPTLDVLRRFWMASTSAVSGGSVSRSPEAEPRLIVTAPAASTISPSSTTSSPVLSGGGGGGAATVPIPLAPLQETTFPVVPAVRTVSTPFTAPRVMASSQPKTTLLQPQRIASTISLPAFYGKRRLPLWEEQVRSWNELALALRAHFKGAIPLHKKYWPTYVQAYLYGDYPWEVIARAIELGGKVVHPVIPYTAWRRSPIFQRHLPG